MKYRIRKIMESQHMTQQVFASFIGVSPGTLSSIFTGRTNPTLNIVESIKSKIPSLSTDWLMFGKGQMYLDISASEDGANSPKLSEDGQPMLDFSGANNSAPISGSSSTPQNEGGLFQGRQGVYGTPNNYPQAAIKITDKHERKITEIRIFYDDQTWETFVPKK